MSAKLPPEGTKEWLVALRDTSNSILRGICVGRNERGRDWPVNWADLRCIAALWIRDHDDSEYAQIIISEASPDAGAMRSALYDELCAAGFKDVEVRSEW